MISKKRKIVLLEDLVIDVTDYASSHPGGKFIFDKMTGKDIGKYFYGGYAFDSDSPVYHRHTNYARRIISKLAIGIISKPPA